jgi:hypothetical protein
MGSLVHYLRSEQVNKLKCHSLSFFLEQVSTAQVVAIIAKPVYNATLFEGFASQFPAAYSDPRETLSVKACDLHLC